MAPGEIDNTTNDNENQESGTSSSPIEADPKKLKKEEKKRRKLAKKAASILEKEKQQTEKVNRKIREERRSSGIKSFGAYLLDLVIVVLGVSISFLLNEWKTAESDKKKEVYILEGLKEDLHADSTVIAGQIAFLDMVISNADSIMNYRGEKADMQQVKQLLSQFNTSVFPESNITFAEMYASGNASIIHNKELLKELNRLYKIQYTNTHEWLKLEKESVMSTILPMVNERFPFAKNYAYTDSSQFSQFESILKDPRILNAVQNNLLIKKGIRNSYQNNLVQIEKLLAIIESEL